MSWVYRNYDRECPLPWRARAWRLAAGLGSLVDGVVIVLTLSFVGSDLCSLALRRSIDARFQR